MPEIECPRTACAYKTPDVDVAAAMQLIQIHAGEHGAAAAPAQAVQQAPEKLRRPHLEAGGCQEMWTYFKSRWSRYKKLSQIAGDTITGQLLECLDEELLLDLHRNSGDKLDTMTEDQLLTEIEMLAVRGETVDLPE